MKTIKTENIKRCIQATRESGWISVSSDAETELKKIERVVTNIINHIMDGAGDPNARYMYNELKQLLKE